MASSPILRTTGALTANLTQKKLTIEVHRRRIGAVRSTTARRSSHATVLGSAAITFKGRNFKGLRGWAGKPFHPPLTDIPIAAYVLGATFDVISVVGGDDHAWGHDFWHAGTYVFVGGALVSVLAALTGLFDWLRSSQAGDGGSSSPSPAARTDDRPSPALR
jgi:hypothetical protein